MSGANQYPSKDFKRATEREMEALAVRSETASAAAIAAAAVAESMKNQMDTDLSNGLNWTEVTVDMGLIAIASKTVTVTGLAWVRSTSVLVVMPKGANGAGVTVAERRWSACVTDIVAGVGFKLSVHAPLLAAGNHTFRVVEVAW